jgi:hypothetical protein
MVIAVDQGGLNVFISYSRNDLAFADQLRVALQGFRFGVTIDLDDITGGDAWKKRLSDLIRDADTVVFVLSPSSADSPTCAWEVKQAVDGGKRILPVLCCALDGANPPPELAALNYMYFYPEPKVPGSGFGKGLIDLVSALNTDSDWLREHTRYQRLAREWDAVGKPVDRRLLSAADIALAKAWAENRPAKAPEVTTLELDFIKASEAEDIRRQSTEAARLKEVAEARKHEAAARMREAEQAKHVAQRTRVGAGVALILALAAVGFASFAYQQRGTALQATETAKVERDNAFKATQQANNATKETQRQLDRANQALAVSINNDLGLSENEPQEFSPRQREALWKLAVVDEPVKRDFISVLVNNPKDLIRVSRGFAQISRALGILRPTPTEGETLIAAVVGELRTADDQRDTPFLRTEFRGLANVLRVSPAKLTDAQAVHALETVLKQIDQTTNPSVLEALGVALQALSAKLTTAQASQALDQLLKRIGRTTNPIALWEMVRALPALPATPSRAQADQALDQVVQQMALTTDPTGLSVLAEALQALPAKLTAAHLLRRYRLSRPTCPRRRRCEPQMLLCRRWRGLPIVGKRLSGRGRW